MKDVTILHTTHPRADDIFQAHAIPRDVIKANRTAFRVTCTNVNCGKHLDKLQTCQKCKSVWYCSKEASMIYTIFNIIEAQIAQVLVAGFSVRGQTGVSKIMARHKQTCTPVERSSGVLKLIQTFVANQLLLTNLSICAVLDLGLLNDRKRIGFDVPFMVRVDVGIEPADVILFTKLLYTDEPVPDKLEGMIQVNSFFSWLPGQSGHDPLTPKRMAMWKQARSELDAQPQRSHDPLGLMEFVNDNCHSITISFPIHRGAFKLAGEAEPFVMLSGITGTMEKPMTVATCMEFINVHIRADKKNQLGLRTEMTQADKEIIKAVADPANIKDSVRFLREKMERETLFARLPKFPHSN
ncbi:hypothetical protein F5I97DRAFT_1999724 [Phlebopus sp. FC_14]|nr:hypothetical protein F5I97DRAFT_1999724 [Phlebopus sp. FC_14]